MQPRPIYRVVQPYGTRVGERTVLSEHSSAGAAFAAVDALRARMVKTGVPAYAIELVVVEADGGRVRPTTH